MCDFNRLSSTWIEWTRLAGMSGVSVSTGGGDCQINFDSDDQSYHLRRGVEWWTVDIIDDRGKRYIDAAKFSNFDLAQKYLLWRWGSFTRSVLGLESLGPQFYKQGYSAGVTLAPTDNEWDTELQSLAGSAILSQPYSTIFSHLILKSADEIERMVMNGATSANP